jgi:hypothetical protein
VSAVADKADTAADKADKILDDLKSASKTANDLTNTFSKLDSNQIPFLIEKDDALSFVGMTLQSGEGIAFDYEYISEPSDPNDPWTGEIKSIKISVN